MNSIFKHYKSEKIIAGFSTITLWFQRVWSF